MGQAGPAARGSREHLGGIALVEQHGADRIFPDRTDAVGEQQPAFVQFDRRAAIADLHEFPGKLRLQNRLAAVPGVQVVGIDEVEVLVVLPADHGVSAVDLAGEQGHALVSRGGSPCSGDIRKEMKSVVSISSDRIAKPL